MPNVQRHKALQEQKGEMMSTALSRRNFFKYMTAVGAVSFTTFSLHAKVTKVVVKYQPTPKDGKVCRDCIHFLPDTNECKIVNGEIDPEGWCTFYLKDPKKA